MSKHVLNNFAKFTEKCLCWSLFFNKVAGWKLETVRSSHWRCSVKKVVLKNFANFTRKSPCWSLFLIKLQFWGPATLLNKTPTQMLSCEYANFLITSILKNICEHLLLNFILKETPTQVFSCEFCELFKNTYFVEDLWTAGSETPVRGLSLIKLRA